MDRSDPLLDTIVAQATPPGVGAIAVVRLSGPRAREIAAGLMGDRSAMDDWAERSSRLRVLRRPGSGEALDHALVTLFRGPNSYTGEDVVEISTHGGVSIPASVVDGCVALGARRAEAGEFTQRAYLNGKLDLTQAEAVGDLVAANSPRGRAVALHQLERGLGERIAHLRGEVIGLSALLVQHIDFPEEDEAPTPIDAIVARAEEVADEVDRLLATAPAGELLREGAVAVLAGRPNSGKSSLFNALVGTERAIVAAEAGTTRDAIEAVVSIDGFPFRLVDTAGLRSSSNQVELLGIEIAHRYLSAADVVLYCQEAGSGTSATEASFIRSLACPVVRVRTKQDLAPARWSPGPSDVAVSVVTGQGLAALGGALRDLVFQGVVEGRDEVPVVTRRRQADLLREARAEIGGFGEALAKGVPAEFASAHLKTAESALEEILGVVATDDVLDRVFRDFCIGK